jgi:hypothetical protein
MNIFLVHDLKKRNEEIQGLLVISEWSTKIMSVLYL